MTLTAVDTARAATGLIADYSRFLDARDGASFARLFAASGFVQIGADRHIEGEEALELFVEKAPRGMHVQGVPSVSVDGETVHCISALVFVDADTGVIRAVRNTDVLVWEGDDLRFAEHHIEIVSDTGRTA
jgi:hypothetical protein